MDAENCGNLYDPAEGGRSAGGNEATRFRTLRSLRRGDRDLKMNLHREGASRQASKKGNTVHHDTWNRHAWLLTARLAILQACLLAVWVAPALAQHEGHEEHEV